MSNNTMEKLIEKYTEKLKQRLLDKEDAQYNYDIVGAKEYEIEIRIYRGIIEDLKAIDINTIEPKC